MEVIDQLASRHIAKLLNRLGDTVAPVQISEIKRQFRFFSDDVKTVINKETSDDAEERTEDRFNR